MKIGKNVKRILFLLLLVGGIFMLAQEVKAGTQQDLYDSAVLIMHQDTGCHIDNATNPLTDRVTINNDPFNSTTAKKVGGGSCDYQTGDFLFIDGDDGKLSQMLNYSICFWSNYTNPDINAKVAIAGLSGSGGDFKIGLNADDTYGFTYFSDLGTSGQTTLNVSNFYTSTDFEFFCFICENWSFWWSICNSY